MRKVEYIRKDLVVIFTNQTIIYLIIYIDTFIIHLIIQDVSP